MNTKRRPPFGAHVAVVLRDPRKMADFSGCTTTCCTIWLVTGPKAWSWKKARPNHLVVVLPDDAEPADFSWHFLRGHEPVLLIGEACAYRRREIATALFRDGVERVLAGRLLMVADTKARAA